LNATLEQLAQYADVQTLKQPDGTVSVLLGGEVPLVLGDQVNPLRVAYPTAADAANPSATPDAAIIDSSGTDVTAKLADGQIGALLSVRNEVLPKLIGGPQDTGDLNTLAASLADKVNGVLSNAGGLPLFTYDSSNATTAASTLALNTALQPQDLVSASSGPPASSNGAALALSNLGSDPTQGPNGTTFGQYYAGLASSIGAQLSQAQTSSDAQKQTVTQARSLRDQLSGVSLDEEALRLIQLQRSYQAASRMVTVVDQMLQSVIDMVQ
jgi:flagellar hook-associated protein 1 FlgK